MAVLLPVALAVALFAALVSRWGRVGWCGTVSRWDEGGSSGGAVQLAVALFTALVSRWITGERWGGTPGGAEVPRESSKAL